MVRADRSNRDVGALEETSPEALLKLIVSIAPRLGHRCPLRERDVIWTRVSNIQRLVFHDTLQHPAGVPASQLRLQDLPTPPPATRTG